MLDYECRNQVTTGVAIVCALLCLAPGMQIAYPHVDAGPSRPSEISVETTQIEFEHVIIDADGPQDPWTKATGDVNGDGLVDLIVGGHTSGGLVWYRNPDWSEYTIASVSARGDAQVADIDGDGDNDLITATSEPALRWYENPGDPETGTWESHLVESRKLDSVGLADFDGDGDYDLVARNQTEFSGDGDRIHFYWQESPTSWSHQELDCPDGEGLMVLDVNRDGRMDVVINQKWYENGANRSWIEHTYTSTWTHPNAYLARGDVNGDGRQDIVASPSEREGETYRISWFEAPAEPTSEWIEHTIESQVEAVYHSLGIADMDNDGDMDVATAEMHQSDDPDEVKIYVNDGSGQSWQKEIVATTGSHAMHLVDIEPDGDIDLFGANWQGQTVDLWKNMAEAQTLEDWERHVIDPDKPWRSLFVTATDIDGDGLRDIVTGGWWYQNPGSPEDSWTRHAIGAPLNNMVAVYDFDNDGDSDILGSLWQGSDADARFVWARNDGSGTFTVLDNVESGEGDFLQGVAIFQDDAALKVALSWHAPDQGIQTLTVPENPSSETWLWTRIATVSQDEGLSAGDIDRDGDVDLLLGTKWLRNDEGAWTPFTLDNGDASPDRNRLADVNRDGRLDAVVGFEAISTLGTLAWYEQGTDATPMWTEHVITRTVGPMSLDVADMDHDGDLDVVVGEHNLEEPSAAKLLVMENRDGNGGSWTAHLVYVGDEHHDGAQVADFDEDGDFDIVSIGWSHGRVLLYENRTRNQGRLKPAVWLPLILRALQ